MHCPQCGASVPVGNSFCTACGHQVRPSMMKRSDGPAAPQQPASVGRSPHPSAGAVPARGDLVERRRASGAGASGGTGSASASSAGSGWDAVPAARLVACPQCGATNAATRRRCARCQRELDGEPGAEPVAAAPPPSGPGAAPPEEVDEPESWGPLILATGFAGLAIVAVLMTILSARGIGPFAGPRNGLAAQPGDPVPVPAVQAEASSQLPASGQRSYGAGNLLDGDPATAWNEAAPGAGTGEWVELRLSDRAEVTRVLVWNGYQRQERFLEHPRVRNLRIEAGDRTFTVTLLDEDGPQAVDLPETVETDVVRLTIDSVYPGERYSDAALSEVEILTAP